MQDGQRRGGDVQMVDAFRRGYIQIVPLEQQVGDSRIDGIVLGLDPLRRLPDGIVAEQAVAHRADPDASGTVELDDAGKVHGAVVLIEVRRVGQLSVIRVQPPQSAGERTEPELSVRPFRQAEDGIRETVFHPVMFQLGAVGAQQVETVALGSDPELSVRLGQQGGDGHGADHVGDVGATAHVMEGSVLRRNHDDAPLVDGQPEISAVVLEKVVDVHGGRVAGDGVGLQQGPGARGGVQDADALPVRAEQDAAVSGVQDADDADSLQPGCGNGHETVRRSVIAADVPGMVRGVYDSVHRVGERDEQVFETVEGIMGPEAAGGHPVDAVAVAGDPDGPVRIRFEITRHPGGNGQAELAQGQFPAPVVDHLLQVVAGQPDGLPVHGAHVVDVAGIGLSGFGLQRQGESVRPRIVVLDAEFAAHQQAALSVLGEGTDDVMRKGVRLGRIMLVGMDVQAVVAAESVLGGDPDVSPPVLIEGVHVAAAESVADGQHDTTLRPKCERAQDKEEEEQRFSHRLSGVSAQR